MLNNRWMLTTAITLFVALMTVVFLSIRFAVNERSEQTWIVHTYQVIGRLQNILSDMQQAETGQRGFIIARQHQFLDRYRAGIANAKNDLATFQSLTADNTEQQARSAKLHLLIDARVEALEQALSAARSPRPATPALLASMNRGKRLMDALQDELAKGMASENTLLAARIQARQIAERNEIVTSSLAATLALLVLVGTGWMLLRNNARLAESEQKLENQSGILQATLDNIRDGIAMFSSHGELCVFNANFFEFLDFPQSLAHTGTPISAFEAINNARDPRIPNSILDGIGDRLVSHHFLSPDGRNLELYRAPVPTGGYVIVCVDTTARTQAENIARQAQKMEAIGHLTGGLAHDFNNLLQVINANLDLLASENTKAPKLADRLQNAVTAVNRGARLTNQLLAFARRQTLDPRSTNLGRLIQEMTDLLQRTLGERVEVECIVAGGLWNTLVDRSQVENALLNLAINARDAMPEGGKLTLEVTNAYLDEVYAAQHAEVTEGQYVMIAVSDTGTGMPPDIIARVFEPFFTTKKEGHGTGLGLSQVYGFVKQSGGHIKVYSEMGQGTTLKLYLPRTRVPQEDVGALALGPVEGGGDSILVVEDDENVRIAAFDTLTALGYTVYKASNAEEALTILNSGPSIDLLFTDVIMPGPINTRELARRAQALQPSIAVLYTSGYTQNAIVHNGKLDEGIFLLSKPYRREELARKIRSILDARPKAVSAPPSPSEPAMASQTSSRPCIVLVVEDEALIRMTTVDMIADLGLEVREAADGTQALAILRYEPAIAVMLTDMGLPGMSGQQLIAEVLGLKPEMKIIVTSGRTTWDLAQEIPPNTAYLPKPFSSTDLRQVLEDWLPPDA